MRRSRPYAAGRPGSTSDGSIRVPTPLIERLSQLRSLTGMSRSYASKAVRGKFPKMPLIRFKLLARALGITFHELAYHLRIVPDARVHFPAAKLPDVKAIGGQKALRDATGLEKGYVSKVANRVIPPSVGFVVKVAQAYKTSLDQVINDYGW